MGRDSLRVAGKKLGSGSKMARLCSRVQLEGWASDHATSQAGTPRRQAQLYVQADASGLEVLGVDAVGSRAIPIWQVD